MRGIMAMDAKLEIWSGGQTGVDRAALDVARELGFAIGGWIPRGRLAEDGEVPPRYAELREADSPEYAIRTELNVRDTDATLVLRWGPASGGTLETIAAARRFGRALYELDLATAEPQAGGQAVARWLTGLGTLRRLNVAGPRASHAPEVCERAHAVLRRALLETARR